MALVQVNSPRGFQALKLMVFVRFDWFFKSRTPDELRRRGATLLLCIMKDKDAEDDKPKPRAGKVRIISVRRV